jgi:RHS repeat-associated protein
MAATASTHFGGEDDFVRRSGLCRPRRRKNSGDQTLYSRGFYYDAVGNRTRLSKDGTDSYYCYDDNNKLLRYRVGGSNCNTGGQLYSFTYDNNGNTLTTTYPDSTVATMTWDHENRMTQLQYPGQTVVGTYAYDGAGHRVQKVESGTTTNYAYDGDRVVLEMNSQLQTQARYTIEGDSYYSLLISMKRGGSSYWYLYDGLGSTRKIIDGNQNVTDSYSYEAFGDITSSSGSTTNPYRYVGALGYAYSSTVTSLLHVGARYYAPGLGRFMSQDQARDGLNWYAYVSCNPANALDPTGMVWTFITGTVTFTMAGFDLMGGTTGMHLGSAAFTGLVGAEGMPSGGARWKWNGHTGTAEWQGTSSNGSAVWRSDDDWGYGRADWGGGKMTWTRVSSSVDCERRSRDLDMMFFGGALATVGGIAAALWRDPRDYFLLLGGVIVGGIDFNNKVNDWLQDCTESFGGWGMNLETLITVTVP